MGIYGISGTGIDMSQLFTEQMALRESAQPDCSQLIVRDLKMKIHRVILFLVFLCGCSNEGAMMEKDLKKKITLDTGNQFAKALVENRYTDAHSMLTAEQQHTWPPEKLESQYKEMIAYGGEPVIVDGHTEFMDTWPNKKNKDTGWVYISISGTSFGEAVTVIVTTVEGSPKIRDIEWGRP